MKCSFNDDPDKKVKGEQAIWRAVILQALEDAVSKSKKPKQQYHKQQALNWLTIKNKEFDYVCDMAGLSADATRRKVKRALLKGCKWRAEPGEKLDKKPPAKTKEKEAQTTSAEVIYLHFASAHA